MERGEVYVFPTDDYLENVVYVLSQKSVLNVETTPGWVVSEALFVSIEEGNEDLEKLARRLTSPEEMEKALELLLSVIEDYASSTIDSVRVEEDE